MQFRLCPDLRGPKLSCFFFFFFFFSAAADQPKKSERPHAKRKREAARAATAAGESHTDQSKRRTKSHTASRKREEQREREREREREEEIRDTVRAQAQLVVPIFIHIPLYRLDIYHSPCHCLLLHDTLQRSPANHIHRCERLATISGGVRFAFASQSATLSLGFCQLGTVSTRSYYSSILTSTLSVL